MNDLHKLIEMKQALRSGFKDIKDAPLNLDKLFAQVANISSTLEALLTEKLITEDHFFHAHMEMLGTDDIPMRDGTLRPQVADRRPWRALGRTIRAGDKVNLEQVPYHKIKCWSDQHFFQEKIISYTNRPFVDAAQMNAEMVERYNAAVEDDDIVIWGGDVSFAGVTSTDVLLNQCKGYKILVVGNHDLDRRDGKLKMMAFDEIHTSLHFDDLIFTHHPWKNSLPAGLWNVHGHVHNKVLGLPRHTNMSCEVVNYAPRALNQLLHATGYYAE